MIFDSEVQKNTLIGMLAQVPISMSLGTVLSGKAELSKDLQDLLQAIDASEIAGAPKSVPKDTKK